MPLVLPPLPAKSATKIIGGMSLPLSPSRPRLHTNSSVGLVFPAQPAQALNPLALTTMPMPAATEKPSNLPLPHDTPMQGFSTAPASPTKPSSVLGKRTEPSEKVAKPKKAASDRQVSTLSAVTPASKHHNNPQDKNTRKHNPSAEKAAGPRYRCLYGCPLQRDIGFTAPNLRKHMKHTHRVFTDAQDKSKLVICVHCKLLTNVDDGEISCNKRQGPCKKLTAEQLKKGQAIWPRSRQEFADTFAYVARPGWPSATRDVCVLDGDDEEEFARVLRARLRFRESQLEA